MMGEGSPITGAYVISETVVSTPARPAKGFPKKRKPDWLSRASPFVSL